MYKVFVCYHVCIPLVCLLAAGFASCPLLGQSSIDVNYDFDTDPEVGPGDNIPVGQSYMTIGTPERRTFFRINKVNDPFASDAGGRTGRIGLPELPENRTTRRAYQPEIQESGEKIRDFSIDFDHPVSGVVEFDAVSAQEDFTVTPFRLSNVAGNLTISLFSSNEFTFSKTVDPRGGAGNRRRLNCKLNLMTAAANGLFFNVTDGPTLTVGGPENFDNFKWSVVTGELVLTNDVNNPPQRKLAVRLTTPPSIRNSANRAAPSPVEALPQEYRQVTVKLTSRNGLVLLNGQPTTTLTFNALNFSVDQIVRLTILGDGNSVFGEAGKDIIDVSIDPNSARHDDFFKNFSREITVDIPDDDIPPRVLSIQIDDGSQRSNVTYIKVTLDRQVTFDANAFALQNLATNLQIDLSSQANMVNGECQVILSFRSNTRGKNALVDGNYEFSLRASAIRDDQGLAVVADQNVRFQSLFGDVINADGRVGLEDLNVFKNVLLNKGFDARLDFDGDGVITGSDLAQARRNFKL